MDKVTISNLQGENGLVNVVRYFMNNGREYLIYSLNEVDESGYTRLYVAKVSGVDGRYNAETLNDTEWAEVKNLVKLIVKANKEGMPVPVQDLNPKKLSSILLKDKKVFKLNAPLVNDLGSNKPNFEGNDTDDSAGTQKSVLDVPSTPSFETPVQPAFEVPSAPSFETPVQPTFEVPSTPSFETTVQPTFEVPSTPSFETPVQPAFEVPSTSPFDAPVQPAFEVPSTSPFDAPVQPTFEVPSTSPFDVPVQPTFDISNSISTETINNQTGILTDDYKKMYDDVKLKNEEMQKKINELNEEIEQYKSIISNIKNIVEK